MRKFLEFCFTKIQLFNFIQVLYLIDDYNPFPFVRFCDYNAIVFSQIIQGSPFIFVENIFFPLRNHTCRCDDKTYVSVDILVCLFVKRLYISCGHGKIKGILYYSYLGVGTCASVLSLRFLLVPAFEIRPFVRVPTAKTIYPMKITSASRK